MLFAVGLMSDPTPIVDHVYQMVIDDKLHWIRNDSYYYLFHYHNDLLKTLYCESQVQLPGHPLHNKYINYYNDRDTTPIYFPSKVYEFHYVKHDIVLASEHREQEVEIPECALIIVDPDEAVTQNLL